MVLLKLVCVSLCVCVCVCVHARARGWVRKGVTGVGSERLLHLFSFSFYVTSFVVRQVLQFPVIILTDGGHLTHMAHRLHRYIPPASGQRWFHPRWSAQSHTPVNSVRIIIQCA